MIDNTFTQDTRGVSIPVEYIIGLGVVVLITGGFTATMVNITDQRSETITQEELDRVNEEIAGIIASTEATINQAETRNNMADSSEEVTVTTHTKLPRNIAGKTYNIRITQPSAGATVTIVSATTTERATKTMETSEDIDDTSFTGGPIQLTYDGNSGTIIITSAR